jgi:pyridoxine 4-dehydrogenase
MRLTGSGMWGEYPDRDGGIALLKHVVEAGVTFIDTADAYGPHTNEVLIHDALYPYPTDLVIATKGGFIRGGPDYADFGAVGNREYPCQCAYLSARRLGIEQIDLYYLHSPHATDVPFGDQVATLAARRPTYSQPLRMPAWPSPPGSPPPCRTKAETPRISAMFLAPSAKNIMPLCRR